MKHLKRILHPTDFSKPAEHALEQAVELAVNSGAVLDVFHAALLFNDDPQGLKMSLEEYVHKIEDSVFEELKEHTLPIRERGVDVEISLAKTTTAWEAIVDKAKESEADLVVMGTHGRRGLSRWLMGSVAENVLRTAPCSVMTIDDDASITTDPFKRILVPVDFSEHSEQALKLADDFAGEGAKITLVHVVTSPIHPSFYAGGVTSMLQLDPSLGERIRERLTGLLGDRNGSVSVEEGEPAEKILGATKSHDADLIVMGTRGLSGLDHVLMGSVAERVTRQAPVPVLTTKQQ